MDLIKNRLSMVLAVVALLLSCDNNDDPLDDHDDNEVEATAFVHVVGFEKDTARYWVNGKIVKIDPPSVATKRSKANGIIITGAGEVHIVGTADTGLGKGAPVVWVNGKLTTINPPSTGPYGDGNDIHFHNNWRYIAGSYSNWDGTYAAYFSGAQAYKLSTVKLSYATAVAGNDTDDFVVGNEGTTGVLWHNRVKEEIAGCTSARDIALSGTDVYIVGSSCAPACNATLWKNGVPQTLPDGALATSILIQGQDIYVTGKSCCEAMYWKNGTAVKLTANAEATDLAVYEGHVYVSGILNSKAVYWVDGELKELPNGAAANGIVVSQKLAWP